MAHLAIVGKPSRLRFQVTSLINAQSGLRSTIHTQLGDVEPLVGRDRQALICMVSDHLTDEDMVLVDEFQARNTDAKLAVVSRMVSQEMREQFRSLKFSNCTLLDASFELPDLFPILRKMKSGLPVFVRRHFRHRASQVCSLIASKSKQTRSIRLQDISQGGLMASYRGLEVAQGEKVHVLVPAEGGLKHHRIVGRIAWLNSSKRLVGVEFDRVSAEISSLRSCE